MYNFIFSINNFAEVWHLLPNLIMENRFIETRNVAILGIIGNLFLAIAKIFVGTIYRSQGLIADGANSIGDIINSFITLIGNKFASKPKDEDHQYGHGKAEAVATQVIGIILCFIAYKIFTNSFSVFKTKEIMNFNWLILSIGFIVITTKYFMYLYTIKIGKKYNNTLVLANAADHKTDIFVTSGTIIGVLFSKFNLWWMDPIIGMLISVWILIQGISISKSAIKILMDSSIDKKMLEKLKSIISSVDGVLDVQKITTHTMGIGYSVEVRIGVLSTLTVDEGHKIASSVKALLMQESEIGDVIVHINPVSV